MVIGFVVVVLLLAMVASVQAQNNQREWLLEYEGVEYPYPVPEEPTNPPPYPAPVEPTKVKKIKNEPTIEPTALEPTATVQVIGLALPGIYTNDDGSIVLEINGCCVRVKEMKLIDGVQWYWFNAIDGWFRKDKELSDET